ncbi:MAG TPA: UbiD family decarboxylase domain-containing protein [Pirellulales bacterium]|nr:UbiD family decarboxylase domain-containing protein [Pirellulales bacterium]
MKLEYNKQAGTGYNAAMARNLSDFLETLAGERELVRVGSEVDPGEELAEIVRRAAETGAPALLFDRVTGSKMPRVANLLATPARACRALGVGRLDELALRTESLLRQSTTQGWLDRLRSAPDISAERLRPKAVRSGAVQQIVRLPRDIDLATLALVRSWSNETGPSITGALVVATDSAGTRRLSPARLVPVDPRPPGDSRHEGESFRPAGPQLAIVDDGVGDWTRLWQSARAAGERLPVAAILGGDPAWRVAAATPLAATQSGAGLDAYEWLAAVSGAALEVVRCRTQPLEVPAEADIVIEGYLDPAAATVPITLAATTGPYLRAPVDAPLLEVEAITERSGCLLPVVVAGTEFGESAVLRKASERLLLPLVKAAIAELVDYSLPGGGGDDRFAFVAIRKSIPLGARRAASALWGVAALAVVKIVVVVDEDVDVHDPAEVWRRVGASVDPGRDVFMRDGPAAAADHSFDVPVVGRQMGIDATRKLPGERPSAGPAALSATREVAELVERRWQEYGIAAKIK